jgi:hypothetical protein
VTAFLKRFFAVLGLLAASLLAPTAPIGAATLAPDFGISAAPGTGFVVRGGLATCPAFDGCNAAYNWEPRYLSIPDLGPAGYVGEQVFLGSQNGFAGTVTLELLGLPAGVTSQTATSIALASNAGAATPLKLQAASTAALGSFSLTVRATSGALVHEATYPIRVVDHLPPPPPDVTVLGSTVPTLVGGGSYQGSVQLQGPAPAGGLVANLSSTDSTLATLPASIAIPEGASSASFSVKTAPVGVRSNASVLAAIGPDGTPGSATLILVPAPALSSLIVQPSSVVSGGSVAINVALNADAASATSVSLSSSNPSVVPVPASATVPAGASTTFVPVVTGPVSAPTSVTIGASLNGVAQTATLIVSPADTVGIKLAQYDASKQVLSVEATSTSATATLVVTAASTNQTIGTLTNAGGGTYKGQFAWPSNPQNVTVKSSLGGSATAAAVIK